MGRGHIPYEGTKVVAICDVDKKHLEIAQSQIDHQVKHFSDNVAQLEQQVNKIAERIQALKDKVEA